MYLTETQRAAFRLLERIEAQRCKEREDARRQADAGNAKQKGEK